MSMWVVRHSLDVQFCETAFLFHGNLFLLRELPFLIHFLPCDNETVIWTLCGNALMQLKFFLT